MLLLSCLLYFSRNCSSHEVPNCKQMLHDACHIKKQLLGFLFLKYASCFPMTNCMTHEHGLAKTVKSLYETEINLPHCSVYTVVPS